MKHSNEITLILPEHVGVRAFKDFINKALELSNHEYILHQYIPAMDLSGPNYKEVELKMKEYQVSTVATGDDRNVWEFERREAANEKL